VDALLYVVKTGCQWPQLPNGWTWASVETAAFVTKLAGFEYTKYIKYDSEGDLRVLKAENVSPRGFKPTAFSRVRSLTVSQLTRSKIRGNDVLMVFVGAGLGQEARVPDD
jgi:type I restriction enzyme S subunit